jgi:hypothetical protein
VGGLGFWDRSYWLPFIIAKTPFRWGAGIVHIVHIVRENNCVPSNTSLVVYWDFLPPVVLIVSYVLYQRQRKALLGASWLAAKRGVCSRMALP